MTTLSGPPPCVLLVSALHTRRERWATLMRLRYPEAVTVFAHDGASASYQSNLHQLAIAVVDIDLPDMSHGLTVAKLRARHAKLAIVLVRQTLEPFCQTEPPTCAIAAPLPTSTMIQTLPAVFSCHCFDSVATLMAGSDDDAQTTGADYVGVLNS